MAQGRRLAQRYGSIAATYDRVWAPPLITFAAPLLNALAVSADEQVVDLGAGTGALAHDIGALCADRTEGMLSEAMAKGLRAVACDIRRAPLADATFDVAVSTFVLQHVPTPGVVAAEARRILRTGGRYGTATWSPDHGEDGGAYEMLAETFAGVPDEAVAMRTWHDRVDGPAKMRRFAKRAGFSAVEAWVEQVEYAWPPEAFFGWATTMGPYGRRFTALDDADREQIAGTLRARLSSASRGDLLWRPTIVYCVAVK